MFILYHIRTKWTAFILQNVENWRGNVKMGGKKEENMNDKKMTVVWVGTFAAGLMIENR